MMPGFPDCVTEETAPTLGAWEHRRKEEGRPGLRWEPAREFALEQTEGRSQGEDRRRGSLLRWSLKPCVWVNCTHTSKGKEVQDQILSNRNT